MCQDGDVSAPSNLGGRGRCIGGCLLGLALLYATPAHAYGTGGIEYIPGIFGLVIVLVVSLVGYLVVGLRSRPLRLARTVGLAVGSLLLGGLLGIATVVLVLVTAESDIVYGVLCGTVAPPVVCAAVSNLGLLAMAGDTHTQGRVFGTYILMCVSSMGMVGVVLGLFAAVLFL